MSDDDLMVEITLLLLRDGRMTIKRVFHRDVADGMKGHTELGMLARAIDISGRHFTVDKVEQP